MDFIFSIIMWLYVVFNDNGYFNINVYVVVFIEIFFFLGKICIVGRKYCICIIIKGM